MLKVYVYIEMRFYYEVLLFYFAICKKKSNKGNSLQLSLIIANITQ